MSLSKPCALLDVLESYLSSSDLMPEASLNLLMERDIAGLRAFNPR